MSKRKDGQARGQYTQEFKLEAVRQVKGGQAVPVKATAKILGVPTQTLGNWIRVSDTYHLLRHAGGHIEGSVPSPCVRGKERFSLAVRV